MLIFPSSLTGFIADITHAYGPAFYAAGGIMVFGSSIIFLNRLLKKQPNDDDDDKNNNDNHNHNHNDNANAYNENDNGNNSNNNNNNNNNNGDDDDDDDNGRH